MPDERSWRKQLRKVPLGFRKLVNLDLYAMRENTGTMWQAHEEVWEWGRG